VSKLHSNQACRHDRTTINIILIPICGQNEPLQQRITPTKTANALSMPNYLNKMLCRCINKVLMGGVNMFLMRII